MYEVILNILFNLKSTRRFISRNAFNHNINSMLAKGNTKAPRDDSGITGCITYAGGGNFTEVI